MSVYLLFEAIGDLILFWVPFYTTVKVLTVIWISCLGGSSFLYHQHIQPFLIENEFLIDVNLKKAKALFQSYSQSLVMQVLNWIQLTLIQQTESSKLASKALLELEKLPPLPLPSPRSQRRIAKRPMNGGNGMNAKNAIGSIGSHSSSFRRSRSNSASPSVPNHHSSSCKDTL